MTYDYPYRLERQEAPYNGATSIVIYSIVRTGEGVICSGPNWSEMRKLVDTANQVHARQMEKT